MSDPLLTILKFLLLALVWLFFVRVLRAVWVEVRGPRQAEEEAPGRPGRSVPPPAAMATSPAPGWGEPRPGTGPVLRLSVVEPPSQRGRSYEVSDEITVGRAQGCGVALPEDSFTSNLHARVWRQDGQVWIEDLGSTNGTYLNKRKLSGPAPLSRGDRLQVGRTVLEVGR